MIRHRKLGAAALALVAGTALAGCGAGGGNAGNASGNSPDSAAHGPGSAVPKSTPSARGDSTAPEEDGRGSAAEPKGARAESAKPTRRGQQTALLKRVPGSGSASCQQVGRKQRDLRAGSFLVGPFDTAISTYGKRQPGATRSTVRLYWVPLNTKPMSGLTLKLTNLDSGKVKIVKQKQIADAEQWKFYDTQLNLKQAGTWRAQATAGPDRGCVTFTLSRA